MWYRNDIIRCCRSSFRQQRDVHSRLMAVYPEVPHWWYIGVFLMSFVMAVICIEVYDTQLPVWALFLSLVLSIFFLVPVGVIEAITNLVIPVQVFP